MVSSRILMGFCVLFAVLGAAAEPTISHVVVNQRWPWSEKVDVDFILSGETNDVEVTATWDTHPEPYRLGTLFSVAPGQRRSIRIFSNESALCIRWPKTGASASTSVLPMNTQD